MIGFLSRVAFSLVVVLGTLAAPDTVPAQEHSAGTTLASRMAEQDRERAVAAEQLRDRTARALETSALEHVAEASWRKAARRFEEAGRLYPTDDRRAVDAFAAAARMYHTAGDRVRAARLSELAGRRALELGSVYTAAIQFRNGAVVYADSGNEVRAQELAWRSCRLSSADGLSGAQRAEIRSGLQNCVQRLERLALAGES